MVMLLQTSEVREQCTLLADLTDSQRRVFQRVAESSSLRFESVLPQLEDVRALVALGLVRLVIVQLPWGVEFELAAVRRSRAR